MHRLIKTLFVLVACCAELSVHAEFRIWEDVDGRIWEGEFVTMNGERVVLRDQAGEKTEYNPESFSKTDLEYLEKVVPPRLSIDVSKTTDSSGSGRSSESVQISASIRQVDTRPYHGKLTAVLSSIGADARTGDTSVAGTMEHVFFLPANRGTPVEFRSDRSSFARSSSKSGKTYGGYVVVVWDRYGNVVAVESNRDAYMENAKNLAPLSLKARLAIEREK